REAVAGTIMTGLALSSSIPAFSKFDRKNYIYPDLMKGYQISQYDFPLCVSGQLDFEVDGRPVRVNITRVHLEEDTARLVHRNGQGESYSLVDVNRSGVPLMEIVSEPDLRSPEDARMYLMALRQILRYLGVSSGNMEEGAFRVDANISQRSVDGSIVGPKVEIKNMNSFRAVERALVYEVDRQREALRSGTRLQQETRGWVEDLGVTVSQRSKEHAHDYRYFPEPDLPPLLVTEAEVEAIHQHMPELPAVRRERFVLQYGLSPAEAALLTEEQSVANYFEATVGSVEANQGDGQETETKNLARRAVIWITGEIFALMRDRGLGIEQIAISPAQLRALIDLVENKTINTRTAKDVLIAVHETGKNPDVLVSERGLAQVSDTDRLREVIQTVLTENPAAVADYRKGKKAAVGFLIGQVMRQMRGTANPDLARQLLVEALGAKD
ncbi:MAG TPA: Asp-tRNA(Asn)/Glu-tRNA(Gln) amidotransferase subunit GatB, partial [Nitrolancea sp.]|nr:Asp-tRNA(Asn)/Glu-tRNA(Gln) amidotransferase subunit GatB [Nitrolancea sp.]